MKFIDMHCDTASRIYLENEKLNRNNFSVDINKLRLGEGLTQFFAFYIDLKSARDPYIEFKKMYNKFIDEIDYNKNEIKIVKNYNDITNLKDKIGAFLTVEEGEVLKGDLKRVKELKELGIGIITLTWNYENSIGYPNYNKDFVNKGLKPLGKELVLEMERQNIIPDCSHLSDGGFYDLLEIMNKPFIATHSNSRAITNHRRNLTDDMIKRLSAKGGVMGLNFCSAFCNDKKGNLENELTTVDEILTHAKHIKNIGGIDVLGLGSDFDGISNKVEIEDSSKMQMLFYALKNAGFTESDIEKVFYKNTLRVLKEYGGV